MIRARGGINKRSLRGLPSIFYNKRSRLLLDALWSNLGRFIRGCRCRAASMDAVAARSDRDRQIGKTSSKLTFSLVTTLLSVPNQVSPNSTISAMGNCHTWNSYRQFEIKMHGYKQKFRSIFIHKNFTLQSSYNFYIIPKTCDTSFIANKMKKKLFASACKSNVSSLPLKGLKNQRW